MTEATTDRLYYEDIEVGAAHRWGAYELTEEEIVEMATRFDPQPWHLDHEAAKESVFGELVACACHLQCVMSALHAQNPRPFAIAAGLGQKEGRFAAPGRIGDVLQLRLEVIAKRESESRRTMGIIEVDNSLLDQDGKLVQQTIGVVLVHRRLT